LTVALDPADFADTSHAAFCRSSRRRRQRQLLLGRAVGTEIVCAVWRDGDGAICLRRFDPVAWSNRGSEEAELEILSTTIFATLLFLCAAPTTIPTILKCGFLVGIS
jgi:hypothetical protein